MPVVDSMTLRDKFRGCLLGGAIGDMAGAAVEAELPGYIVATYQSIDQILATDRVPEFTGPDWRVGRFTDDTQMTVCVAEWLIAGEAPSAERLFARFAEAHEPWRRYGPGTEGILRMFPRHREQWRALSTSMFPQGSFGNGSAMRVAPLGLAYFDDPAKSASVAIESSRPTHSHSLAYQGAVLQTLAVGMVTASDEVDPTAFLHSLRDALTYFSDLLQDTSPFARALDSIEQGLARGASCGEMSSVLGTGVAAHESVPMALYCFLRHPRDYVEVIRQAVFLGGDTDTIASMAGALSGAFLGRQAIPEPWLLAVRDERYSTAVIEVLADGLFAKFGSP